MGKNKEWESQNSSVLHPHSYSIVIAKFNQSKKHYKYEVW